MQIQNNIARLILDKNWVKEFLENNSSKIFNKKVQVNVLAIDRSYTFNTESYNLLYSFEVDHERQELRASFSTQASKETNYKILKYFYENGFNEGNILISKPYIFFENYNLLLYGNIPGKTFMHELNDDIEYLVNRTMLSARALRKIHKMPLPTFELWSQDWNLNIPVMKNYYPELAEKINNIHRTIITELEKTKTEDLCHGDFQPNNLIFHQNKLYLIDFGSACVLDKEIDIASFIIQLKVMLQRFGDPANFENLKEQFLAEYGDFDKTKFNLYSILLSLRILDFFIVFPETENNRERIPFGYQLVREYLGNINIQLKDA